MKLNSKAFPPRHPWRKDHLEFIPLSAHIGAEVRGVDLANITDAEFEIVHDAWLKHLVLVFRGQSLSDADQIEFSRRFGDLDLARQRDDGVPYIPNHPEILVISNVKENGKVIGALGDGEAVWHIDLSYKPNPSKASALYSLEVPESGGNTGFLSGYAAYDAMPEALRARAEKISIKHDATLNSAGMQRKGLEVAVDVRTSPGAIHPAVRTHPETGRKSLYLGRRQHAYVTGMSIDQSEALLDELWTHATQDSFSWHHKWHVGDLVLWDNRCVMHRRDSFDASARRVMHRTQIKEDKAS